MKLNFDYCKTCNDFSKQFLHTYKFENTSLMMVVDGFGFFCNNCGFFEFNIKKYMSRTFDSTVPLLKITDEQWEDIKKMEVVAYDKIKFNNCPFKLEHLVDNET